MESQGNVQFEVDRRDYAKARLVEETLGALGKGQVRMRVLRFALTANNVTYAAFGDMLGYWDFFPAEGDWGRVPAMGWATVESTNHPDVPAGGLYYGWFPMARNIDLTVSTTPEGLRDDGDHRAAHAPVYRSYGISERDPLYQAGEEAEDRHALLRGLAVTGYLIDDFFVARDYYGAQQILVLSASSKTAIAYAQCASARGVEGIVGLTSQANREFVESLGFYDRVVTYDAVEEIAKAPASVIIDMAGDASLRAALHNRLADRLKYSLIVGGSHHDAPPDDSALPGPAPELFFAPTQVEKRLAEFGADEYRKRIRNAVFNVIEGSRRWLTVSRTDGPDAVAAAWQALLDGKVAPDRGQIVSL